MSAEAALDFVPAPAAGVESCELDGERLVWHGTTLHRLNTIGALVWEHFDGRTTVGDLSRILAEGFAASEADVQSDLLALCTVLLDEGLLRGGRSGRPDPPPLHFRYGRPPSGPLDPADRPPYNTGRFLAFHHDFAIRTDDARLAAYFTRTLRSFAASGSPARWYSVISGGELGERYRIYLDDEGLFAAPDIDRAARYMLWHVNAQVIQGTPDHLLVHAAGATMGKGAVVLPGEMNAGKTTLVAGLVLDGFGFLTDELAALNLTTGLVDPYPRPLNIGSGSWEVLSRLRPADRDEDQPFPERLWHVDATAIRSDAVASPARIRWVIAPSFDRGALTRLQPLSRPETVQLLHRNTFNRERFGGIGIRALVSAVRGARCARLVNGDLASAVAAVHRFLEDPG
jgi:hypothetical protein